MRKEKLTHFIPQTRVNETTRVGIEKIANKYKRDMTEIVRLSLEKMVEKDLKGEIIESLIF